MKIGNILHIINEGFENNFRKKVVEAYEDDGIEFTKARKDDLLKALNVFNTKPDVKRRLKGMMKQWTNGDMAQAIVNTFIDPEDFVFAVYNDEHSGDFETDDFYVYACRTFEKAQRIAQFYHTGSLPKLSNEEIHEKYNVNVPKPATHYDTDKTPAEFLEEMKSAPYFMNPSWCICANKDRYWEDMYNIDPSTNSEPARCYIVISKKWPNVRFCIVKSSLKTEIEPNDDFSKLSYTNTFTLNEFRDPWQIQPKNWQCDDSAIDVGYEIARLAFGNSPEINKLIETVTVEETVKTAALVNGFNMFGTNKRGVQLDNVEADLRLLKNGKNMFVNNEFSSFEGDLSSLQYGESMFARCEELKKFGAVFGSLVDATGMFYHCGNLTEFDGNLSTVRNAKFLFKDCGSLENIIVDLRSATDCDDMFWYCPSLKNLDIRLDNYSGNWYNIVGSDCTLENLRIYAPSITDISSAFHYSNLKSFEGDLRGAYNASKAFSGSEQLETVKINLASAIHGDDMFADCEKLTNVDINAPRLKDGQNMFYGCKFDSIKIDMPNLTNRNRYV